MRRKFHRSEGMEFQDRQKRIYELSSFISEQEKWLEGVLGKLQWTKEYLSSTEANLEQCPYNSNHYVPSSSLESHKGRCWYSSVGVKVDRETAPTLASTGAFYGESNIPHVQIDHATEEAIHKLAPQLEAEQSLPLSINLPSKQSDSLESTRGTPPELLTLPPNQIISYVKSWQKVPSDFTSMHPSTLNLPQIKGWLFQNLPEKHTHSSALGGEIVTVETIMSWLSSTGSSAASVPSLTPDALVNKLTPMLGLKSRAFVLELWRHVHISRLQTEHNIQDSVVEDVVPLTAAALLNRPEHDEEKAPAISERIKEFVAQTGTGENEISLPLPMDHVFYKFSRSERRMLYDYAVEVTGNQGSLSKVKELDPDLYRDDAAALKAKLKAQKQSGLGDGQEEEEAASGNYLEQLKRKRDYRRRRQTYRAKNVHITRKTPREIFRDIISNRMEEIAAATEVPANESSSDKQQTNDIHEGAATTGSTTDAQIASSAVNTTARASQEREEEEGEWPKSPKPEDGETVKEEGYSERSRSYKRKKHHRRSRSRSRSGSRSRSKERHRKKHKKHRSRSRSPSRERSRHKRKRKHHSRSKSPSN